MRSRKWALGIALACAAYSLAKWGGSGLLGALCFLLPALVCIFLADELGSLGYMPGSKIPIRVDRYTFLALGWSTLLAVPLLLFYATLIGPGRIKSRLAPFNTNATQHELK